MLAAPAAAQDVAILLTADAPAYREAIDGFKKAMPGATFTEFDMRGNPRNGAAQVRAIAQRNPDLIYAVGVYAAQALAQQRARTPVVYSMVLNPPASVANAPANMTGASMNISADTTFDYMKKLNPNLKKVGTIYSAASTGFLIKRAEAAAKAHGIQLVAEAVRGARDVPNALKKLAGQNIDALWIIPEQSVLAPAMMQEMVKFSVRQRVPLVGFSDNHANMGSVLTLKFDSGAIGEQAGGMARRIIAGADPSQVDFTLAEKVSIVVNVGFARKLGLDVPSRLQREAEKVIE